jgi:hypothetical protein
MSDATEFEDRIAVKEFVLSKVNKFDIERFHQQESKDLLFKNLKDFKRWQQDAIDDLAPSTLATVKGLMDMIQAGKIHNMDKESCVDFSTSGFCWNLESKLVIFNER